MRDYIARKGPRSEAPCVMITKIASFACPTLAPWAEDHLREASPAGSGGCPDSPCCLSLGLLLGPSALLVPGPGQVFGLNVKRVALGTHRPQHGC